MFKEIPNIFMTNRDALLLAAKKCLLEKGFNRTTARDIASVAGVSLAAIGYHFSTKEALLTEALLLAFGEWDQDLQKALQTAAPAQVSPAERFEATWAKIIATFETHRPLWVANFEIFAQMVAQPTARNIIASKIHLARSGLAAMFLNQEESSLSAETVRTIGTFHHVLLSGLVLQWLIDPSSALSAKNLTRALRATAASFQTNESKTARRSKIRPAKRRKT
jgi:AcrR family transcriptional regulator